MFAHEVNNLITQVGGRAQLALMHMDKPDLSLKALELACHASTQIAQLSEIFIETTKNDRCFIAQYRVSDIHRRALEFVSDQDIQAFGFEFHEASSDIGIIIPPILLQQVLLNIYLNAIRATEDSGDPANAKISTRVERLGASDQCSPWNIPLVRIIVEDTGIGMSPEHIQRAFHSPARSGAESLQPTNRDRGRGHGLGLAVCEKLLADASGTISVESTVGVGTKMIITLPESPQP